MKSEAEEKPEAEAEEEYLHPLISIMRSDQRDYIWKGWTYKVDAIISDRLLYRLNVLPRMKLCSICVGHDGPGEYSHIAFKSRQPLARLMDLAWPGITVEATYTPASQAKDRHAICFSNFENKKDVSWLLKICRRLEKRFP